MEIQGRTIAVLPIESGTSAKGNTWQKQIFVIETFGNFPKKVAFQLFGDRVQDCPSIGKKVNVSFDAESREWNGKWFTQLNAWKVDALGGHPDPVGERGPLGVVPAIPAPAPAPTNDDLPF